MAMPVSKLIGQTFGRLTVIERAGTMGKNAAWLCECACGGTAVTHGGNLKSGHTTSCGCAKVEANTVHGLRQHPLYKTWDNMLSRTSNPKATAYECYGGRGITVFPDWQSDPTPFIAWIEEYLGPKPEPSWTLDRIAVDGNYEPGNLRWASKSEQTSNRRPRVRRAA